MPEMDGYMLCRELNKDPTLGQIPFIFLTATYLSDADERFAMSLGAEVFIKKPVDLDELVATVSEFSGAAISHDQTVQDICAEVEFTEQHSRRILSALQSKSFKLESLVAKLETTQKALQASEERYRLISTTMSDYVYAFCYNEQGQIEIEWISGAFKTITGFEANTYQTLNQWVANIVPDDRKWFYSAMTQTTNPREMELEYRFKTASGDIIWLRDISSAVIDDDNKTVGRVGAVRDVTKAKEDEIQYKRLATAVESAAESIIITDVDGQIRYVNPAFEAITGHAADEVMGKNPRLLQSGKHGKEFYQRMWLNLKVGEVWRGNIINKKKDGSLFEIEAVISPVVDNNGTINNFIAVQRDMTREKILEAQVRQSQKLEAIGTLAGGIAHDFNNILSAILGFSELCLSDVEDDANLRSNINEILRAGKRARDLVQQILTFARQSDREERPINFGLIVKEAIKMLRASIPATIEMSHELTSKGLVMGDPSELHQIIMNLCTNASQAMESKSGEMTIRLHDVALDENDKYLRDKLKAGYYVKLVIGDTGMGMTPSQMERIFDPFYTTKEKGEGTGLGLSVVHGIVENHGGIIKVYSEPGIGSTFTVLLPAIKHGAFGVIEAAPPPLAQGREHVLFLDDEPSIVKMTTQILTLLGYQVTSFNNAPEAVACFEAAPEAFDIVISDVTMPKMNGAEVARRMMAIRRDIPVILCSGFTKLFGESDAKAMGIRSILTKPLSRNELANTIRAVLDGGSD
jgi:PAS domain S-box-containing protein